MVKIAFHYSDQLQHRSLLFKMLHNYNLRQVNKIQPSTTDANTKQHNTTTELEIILTQTANQCLFFKTNPNSHF